MSKRIKIGDIVEISTAKGFSYTQFIHKHPKYGALLRVLPGFFDHRPSTFLSLVNSRDMFMCFFPLQAAVNREIFNVVGNLPLPEKAKKFPLFRAGNENPQTGKVEIWWLWDGEKEWKIGNLSAEQRKLPVLGVWNDTLLKDRIEAGWLPEKDEL